MEARCIHSRGTAVLANNLASVSPGTPEDMRAMVGGYAASGATMLEIVAAFAAYDQLVRQIRLFGTDVVPAFR